MGTTHTQGGRMLERECMRCFPDTPVFHPQEALPNYINPACLRADESVCSCHIASSASSLPPPRPTIPQSRPTGVPMRWSLFLACSILRAAPLQSSRVPSSRIMHMPSALLAYRSRLPRHHRHVSQTNAQNAARESVPPPSCLSTAPRPMTLNTMPGKFSRVLTIGSGRCTPGAT
jgi:hypothetical protein